MGRNSSGVVLDHQSTQSADIQDSALRAAEEKFARLFNASPDALIICRQAEGGILEANEGFERLLGYSRAEAIGRSLVDLSLYANPADQQRIATELAAQGFVRDLELDIWTKDGDLGQVSLTAEPIASHGQSCWLIILRDITARKQVEEALHLSEESRRSLVEIMPAAMYTCDSEGLITYYNPRAAELWGRQPQLGEPDERFCGSFRLFRPDGTPLPHNETPMAVAVQTGKGTRQEEVIIERPDGSTLWVSVNIDPLFDQTGHLIGAINVFEDITKFKQVEEALRLSEESHRSLVEIMPMAMFTCDSEGLITYYNQRAAELWGRQPQLRNPDDRFCGSFRIYRPDGSRLPHDECPMAVAVLSGRGTRHEEIHIERPDGATIHALVNIDPLYDRTGRRIGAINVFEDITKRKLAEVERERLLAELKAQWSRLAVLFQQAPTFLAILRGPDYVFEMVNPAYQMLVNQRAVLGKPARNALPEFEDQGYFALLDHVYASGEPFVGNEMRIELQDGDGVIDYYLNFIYHPILDRDGTVTGIFVHGVDISEQVRARQQVEELVGVLEKRVEERTQQVRDLAARLSLAEHGERRRIAQILHDHVQQMLYGLQMRTHLTKVDASAGGLDRLQTHLDEMKRLLGETIQTTRTLAVELSPPVLENEGLPQALGWLANQMKELHALQVDVETYGDCQKMDKKLQVVLFQIVRELLFNVTKHAQVDGASVICRRDKDVIIVTVEDGGRGFDSSSVSSHTDPKTGFGLSSIRERLGLFEGQLDIQSAPLHGTRVTVTLPLL